MKIINECDIIYNENLENKDEIIKKMLDKITNNSGKKEKLFEEIMNREKIDNTVLGFKFAIPHSKTDLIDKPYVVYSQLKKSIIWAEDEEKVKYVMLILVPKTNSNLHIDILKNISTKLIDSDFRKNLEKAKNISEIYKLLNS